MFWHGRATHVICCGSSQLAVSSVRGSFLQTSTKGLPKQLYHVRWLQDRDRRSDVCNMATRTGRCTILPNAKGRASNVHDKVRRTSASAAPTAPNRTDEYAADLQVCPQTWMYKYVVPSEGMIIDEATLIIRFTGRYLTLNKRIQFMHPSHTQTIAFSVTAITALLGNVFQRWTSICFRTHIPAG
jgi:hypothetical protein